MAAEVPPPHRETPGRDANQFLSRAHSVLDAAKRAVVAYGRDDLADRLDRAQKRLDQPDLHALVVGEFKQGKSTLINALVNAPVCPVADDVATVVPTIVRHGGEPSAEVILEPEEGAEPSRRAIPIGEVPRWAAESGNPDNTLGVRAVEIRVPRRLLGSGVAFVDTPGVGGLQSVHGAATTAALGMAEVVVFVTDASAELSAYEMAVLRDAVKRCPNVLCVLTKIDLYPSWRRIAELDRGHLDAAGLGQLPLLAVSSVLRQAALEANSKELNDESGYSALLRHLNTEVIDRAQALAVRMAMSDVRVVLDQMVNSFRSELEVLTDPARAEAVVSNLDRAKAKAEALRTMAARWQQTLSDGSQDISAEIDHDLRGRVRRVMSDAETTIDEGDPLNIWDELGAWVRHQVAVEIGDHYEELRRRADELAARVAEHFAVDEEAIVHPVDVVAQPFDSELDASFERAARGSGALAAARGSYGGLLMFGMAGQMIGMTLLNPLTAVVGLGLGRRALRDEKKRNLTMRQQQAKMAIRRYLDDLSFTVGKQSRDAVRQVQRELRDEFTRRAEEVQRSTKEALLAADAAAKSTAAETERRRRDLEAELERLGKVRVALDELQVATR
jgi:hypothetical protein